LLSLNANRLFRYTRAILYQNSWNFLIQQRSSNVPTLGSSLASKRPWAICRARLHTLDRRRLDQGWLEAALASRHKKLFHCLWTLLFISLDGSSRSFGLWRRDISCWSLWTWCSLGTTAIEIDWLQSREYASCPAILSQRQRLRERQRILFARFCCLRNLPLEALSSYSLSGRKVLWYLELYKS
jgi:hypothetical protein